MPILSEFLIFSLLLANCCPNCLVDLIHRISNEFAQHEARFPFYEHISRPRITYPAPTPMEQNEEW